MTVDDVDRRLAAFLDEGPIRAPERPVEAAIAHARAHPRRRDPFAAFRRDPMGRPARVAGLRPALVLAALALVLALSAVALVGSLRQPVVLPPVPTPSASPVLASPSPSPSPSASPSPTASPSEGPQTVEVEITDANGLPKTVVVTDRSGLLEQAVAWEADPDRPQNAEIEVVQLPADEGGGMDGIIVQWVALSCPDPYSLTIDETAREIVLEVPFCEADAIGVDHQLLLVFSEDVPADEVEATLEQPGG